MGSCARVCLTSANAFGMPSDQRMRLSARLGMVCPGCAPSVVSWPCGEVSRSASAGKRSVIEALSLATAGSVEALMPEVGHSNLLNSGYFGVPCGIQRLDDSAPSAAENLSHLFRSIGEVIQVAADLRHLPKLLNLREGIS